MDLIAISLKTIFFYIFIIVIFRLMGKREVGELSLQDLVVSLLITEIVSISIENYNDSILFTVIPVLILLLLELLMGYISLKSNNFRKIIDGKPALIINNGKINYKEMKHQRYNLDDLLLELRNQSIKNIKEVEYAILENNGHLNIFKYNFFNDENPFPIILDGIIQKDTLNYINKDINWIMSYLDKNNILLCDVFYSFYKNNKIYIIKKDELEN